MSDFRNNYSERPPRRESDYERYDNERQEYRAEDERYQNRPRREKYEEPRYRNEMRPDQGGWYGDSNRYLESEQHRGGVGGYGRVRPSAYPINPGNQSRQDEGYFSSDYARYYDDDEEYIRAQRARRQGLPTWVEEEDFEAREAMRTQMDGSEHTASRSPRYWGDAEKYEPYSRGRRWDNGDERRTYDDQRWRP
jgi:hypothetical protein